MSLHLVFDVVVQDLIMGWNAFTMFATDLKSGVNDDTREQMRVQDLAEKPCSVALRRRRKGASPQRSPADDVLLRELPDAITSEPTSDPPRRVACEFQIAVKAIQTMFHLGSEVDSSIAETVSPRCFAS